MLSTSQEDRKCPRGASPPTVLEHFQGLYLLGHPQVMPRPPSPNRNSYLSSGALPPKPFSKKPPPRAFYPVPSPSAYGNPFSALTGFRPWWSPQAFDPSRLLHFRDFPVALPPWLPSVFWAPLDLRHLRLDHPALGSIYNAPEVSYHPRG
jgi:hypothetical protein